MIYTYNAESNTVDVFPEGDIAVSEITNLYRDILNDDRVSDHYVEVVHLDKVTNFQFSSREFSSAAVAFRQLLEKKRIKAIVCIGKTNLHYGVGRMMQAVYELEFPEFMTHVVWSEEEAQMILDDLRG